MRMTALLPTLQRVASRKATRPCTLTNQPERGPAAHDIFSSNGPGFHSLPPTPPPYHGITYTPSCHRTQPPTTAAKSKKHAPTSQGACPLDAGGYPSVCTARGITLATRARAASAPWGHWDTLVQRVGAPCCTPTVFALPTTCLHVHNSTHNTDGRRHNRLTLSGVSGRHVLMPAGVHSHLGAANNSLRRRSPAAFSKGACSREACTKPHPRAV